MKTLDKMITVHKGLEALKRVRTPEELKRAKLTFPGVKPYLCACCESVYMNARVDVCEDCIEHVIHLFVCACEGCSRPMLPPQDAQVLKSLVSFESLITELDDYPLMIDEFSCEACKESH